MAPILIREIEQTCFACPSQWEGTTHGGEPVYVRLRHGYLYIEVAGETVYEDHPRGFDGVMSYAELRARTRHVFVWPDECVDCTFDEELDEMLVDEA